MYFSDPGYAIYLVAVFFLYALSRWGGGRYRWARVAVLVLLADIVFLVVAPDPAALWDPIGGLFLRPLVLMGDSGLTPDNAVRYAFGFATVVGAFQLGRARAAWIGSDEGQSWIARGLVASLVAVGFVVFLAWRADAVSDVTGFAAANGHLLVLGILAIGLGAGDAEEHRPLGRIVILFVASALFYHAWASSMPGAYKFLLALLLSTIALDYYLGLWIDQTEDPWRRRALVIVSLCSNLGILCAFKYTDFLSQDVLHLPVRRLNLLLPAGISFHTFQSLSYTIDVYRRQLKPTKSVLTFATFVLFFPQLVAGPIVRAQDLIVQLEDLPALRLREATEGLFRIVVGLFKKIAIADTLGLVIVERVFDAPSHFSSLEVLAGIYAFALQLFCDFSAYSDIAIGSAAVLGFTLPENFRTPYRSANLQEFWRRWHISLSTWLRDYLYISLGGSRGAPWRTYVNLSLTMLLGGLWHGASWNFVVWGALHGFGLAITRFFQRTAPGARGRLIAGCAVVAAAGVGLLYLRADNVWEQLVLGWLTLTPLWAVLTASLGADEPDTDEAPITGDATAIRCAMVAAGAAFLYALYRLPSSSWWPLLLATWALGWIADLVERPPVDPIAYAVRVVRRALAALLVFQYVCLGWVFFRASSFANALDLLRQLARGETDHANLGPIVMIALAAGFVTHFFADGSVRWLRDRWSALPAPAQGALLAIVFFVLRELGHTKIVPFYYFAF